MSDSLVRVVSQQGHVRGLACATTELVQEACKRHGTSPLASVCLSRGLTAGVLMGGLLKLDQRVAMRFEGNGPLNKMLIEADADGGVRGYVGNPEIASDTLDPSRALGSAGLLTVTKDLRLKETYSGTVHLVSGKIGEDVAYYLVESEQIPSAVGVGEFLAQTGEIGASGGFLIQALPPSEDANIESIIRMISKLPSLDELLRQGQQPLDILHHIFAEVPFDVLRETPLAFRCSCSSERMERALMLLGVSKMEELVSANETLELICQFCHHTWNFTVGDLHRILDEARSAKK